VQKKQERASFGRSETEITMRKALYMFGILNDSDIEWLSKNGRNRALAPGDVIITEGQSIDTLFIVLSGELQVYSKDLDIARLQAGEIVGEISFVDSRPPLSSVKALADSNVLAILADRLRTKLGKDAHFASRFYRAVAVFLADRLRVTTARFGYGHPDQDTRASADPDEVHPELLESIDLAATRFDKLLRRRSAPPA
jgi:CRP/FNR family transcriptional regulator, cyclic AMP receptor protein